MRSPVEQLREIDTLESLVDYLRDEMGWPIEVDQFDEIVFDYTPEELGLDDTSAAKINSIRRLRPLSTNQPWGVFFIEFEPKRLPVVALRRILNEVITKKRATASQAERPTWDTEDLMFISSMGEGDERTINFAHFNRGSEGRLPSLKVVAWDAKDTPLHMEDVADKLTKRLAWPDDEDDVAAWRDAWSSAFTLRHREVITTSRELAVRLAALARDIRDRIVSALEVEVDQGALTSLLEDFRKSLIHDLNEHDFADMYAQTIAYGLLSARIVDPNRTSAGLPLTNPLLRDLMHQFLHLGEPARATSHSGLDFDELGVNEVIDLLDEANLEQIVRDFGDRNPTEDPVIHFYEHFLTEYDPDVRMQRGVFYTPRPAVSYIVRSVDQKLRSEFGLVDGLADTATWGEVSERLGAAIPDNVSAHDPFVRILDPATGTGTFLVEVVDAIHGTLTRRWANEGRNSEEISDLWNTYVPTDLLPRLIGYELLMAPYAIAHLKLGLKLLETGYRFESDERVGVYLTNALEPGITSREQFDFAVEALAQESREVSRIKRDESFTVVIGNPPYAQYSQNLTDHARSLVDAYREVDGRPIKERGALAFERNLQDDYVKFLRLGEQSINESGLGVLGMITNHSFRSNLTLRGMRHSLLESFSAIQLLDLHGSSQINEQSPLGTPDENIFDIQQGVAITIARALPDGTLKVCESAELWGTRDEKYRALSKPGWDPQWTRLNPSSDLYLLRPRDSTIELEYSSFSSIDAIFPVHGSAITTGRDSLVIAFTMEELRKRINTLQDPKLSEEDVSAQLGLRDSSIWSVTAARSESRAEQLEQYVISVDYRPFDSRLLLYHDAWVSSPRHPTMDHMGEAESLGLAICKQQGVPGFRHVFASKRKFDEGLVSNRSREKTYCFPLFLYDRNSLLDGQCIPNIDLGCVGVLSDSVGRSWKENHDASDQSAFGPETLFHYVYALLHSTQYRVRYEEELKLGFPRLPLTPTPELFMILTRLGGYLQETHTSPHRVEGASRFIGHGDATVSSPVWANDSIWFQGSAANRADDGAFRLETVPAEAWDFEIGSYKPLQKWLKDRDGRALSNDELEAYKSAASAVVATLRCVDQIDEVIDSAGGWPTAFDRPGIAPDAD